MEPKQIVMLAILLGAAFFGSIWLVYILRNLDKDNEDTKNNPHGGDMKVEHDHTEQRG